MKKQQSVEELKEVIRNLKKEISQNRELLKYQLNKNIVLERELAASKEYICLYEVERQLSDMQNLTMKQLNEELEFYRNPGYTKRATVKNINPHMRVI